ncbi:MAG TPA: hypothetical protein VFI03_11060 [Solirubrobacterales bacterium]|nr:hypothetical protein [Solirubrobacterales bacterium]
MSRFAAASCLLLLALCASAPAALGAETWRSQQPAAGQGDFPLLGEVGDIECWNGEANRCLLITAGNGGVAAGLFAYDGAGWYRYSTVCGGHEGRIAWAGPDEFWTVSDQQPGQATTKKPPSRVSLCHFKGGRVVASYGEPVEVATSYQPMSAAACSGPSNCWFGGERLPATGLNQGAFHLHWNGSSISPIPSPTVFSELSDPGRSVSSLAFHQGGLYEGVDVREGDVPNAEEEEKAELGPSFLHRIEPGAPIPFQPLFGAERFSLGGQFAEASELQGFHLTGEDGEGLWAVAGSEGLASVTVLRLGSGGLAQVPLQVPETPPALFGEGVRVSSVAAEPGAERVWVAFRAATDPAESLTPPARLIRVHADGTLGPETTLPLPGDQAGGEPIGNKGVAGPIACTATEQCWLATRRGWLFHLGPDPAKQDDPAMHVLVTSRPPDNSLPSLPPIELPEDDSGAGGAGSSGQEPVPGEIEPLPKQQPPLLSKIKQRLIGGTLIELSFSLREKAKVRLIARRKGKIVAKTKSYTMTKGRHSLRLRLDPKRWPTKLDLKAKEVKKGSK